MTSAPLLPAGTVLVMTGWYDNTAGNELTPDPEIWYARGLAHRWTRCHTPGWRSRT